jgi:hypothetical protein
MNIRWLSSGIGRKGRSKIVSLVPTALRPRGQPWWVTCDWLLIVRGPRLGEDNLPAVLHENMTLEDSA